MNFVIVNCILEITVKISSTDFKFSLPLEKVRKYIYESSFPVNFTGKIMS